MITMIIQNAQDIYQHVQLQELEDASLELLVHHILNKFNVIIMLLELNATGVHKIKLVWILLVLILINQLLSLITANVQLLHMHH